MTDTERTSSTAPAATKAGTTTSTTASTTARPSPARTGGAGIYRVCAPYVTLKSKPETGGEVVLGYFEGALLPETVDAQDLARHIRKGMVEELEGDDLKSVKEQQAEAEKAEKAAEKAETPEDKEGAEAIEQAKQDRAAAEKAAAEEEAKAKKERTPLVRASDSPRGTKTAQTG